LSLSLFLSVCVPACPSVSLSLNICVPVPVRLCLCPLVSQSTFASLSLVSLSLFVCIPVVSFSNGLLWQWKTFNAYFIARKTNG
jgi:hypothetical protein